MATPTDQSIGMMDGAYFVGRKEILDWINSICCLNLSKIEQTCTGAVACQLLDSLYPGQIPMSKVDWTANKDYEYINNYKILQKFFTKFKIDRHIEVDRLIRGKYQDNLEFMQWYKRFHELNAPNGITYDAVGQRLKGKGGTAYEAKYKNVGGSDSSDGANAVTKKRPVALNKQPAAPDNSNTGAPPAPSRASTNSKREVHPTGTSSSPKESSKSVEISQQNEKLINEIEAYKATVDGLEKERDFYFGKLRDIELLLQAKEENANDELVKSIFQILYATEEDFLLEDETASKTANEMGSEMNNDDGME